MGILTVLAFVVVNDLGGSVDERLIQMNSLQDTSVEIQGTCLSACTMFLGLPHVCVSPQATLGFHGPRTALPGIPLPRKEFEKYSHVMAQEYPPKLRSWFLKEARYHINDIILLSGSEVIKLGSKECK